ncbi:MAG: transcription-repair coupling factor [Lachnospiraceae bacterium]|jgi:transcription-repair coupling factor (superfamily II helicase)|nr:transcription-repair coupling factor [Lachnospiraceae bacterium]
MKALIEPLKELEVYSEIQTKLKNKEGLVLVSGLTSSSKSHMIYTVGNDYKNKIIVCFGEQRTRQVYEEIKSIEEDTYLYPAKDMLFYQADIRSKDLLSDRMKVYEALINSNSGITIVSSFEAFMDSVVERKIYESKRLHFKELDEIDYDQIKLDLVRIGYERAEQVEGVGQFAVRGDILDIFPIANDNPIRIELFGDEIDSIREFQVETQRTTERLEEVYITPATEFASETNISRVTFFDYFNKDDTIISLDEPGKLLDRGKTIEDEYIEAGKRRLEEGLEALDFKNLLLKTKDLLKKISTFANFGVSLLDAIPGGFKIAMRYSLNVASVGSYRGSFEMLTRDLKKYKRDGYRVLFLSNSRTRAKRLATDLLDYDINSFFSEDKDKVIEKSQVMTSVGALSEGYIFPMLRFAVIAEGDIFGKSKKKKKKKTKDSGMTVAEFNQLKPGDYVVHENHGLGKFVGIEKLINDEVEKDYMKIEYQGSGVLYIPATSFNLINKYSNSDAKKPPLNKLGSNDWKKTTTKVKKAVDLIAEDLVELYAKRRENIGYQYEKDTTWQTEFEELFPYDETEDQLNAIADVKSDMESTKVMDRLICGDVGFGKTEVAIRAAFKAVQENKQVLFLVPTTILAEQHYHTFVERMKDFPVKIGLLCRFVSRANQQETIKNLKKGSCDIIIGTHRALSKDVVFKDLGLLIIDEEQRFGVRHKEKMKQMKESIDVMTLTATPIPRTLHMSLIGIRDISVLEEAPEDRFPIQTYVMEFSMELVREAISRELEREGQVYYVYNRVEDIAEVAYKIQTLVPDANVAYAHGRMTEHRLEQIMYDFIEGDIDVLVSTTIIETGLDISNVNTIIVQNADRFGLSQLYQLRGRVGRSNRMAYAFFMYQRDKILREEAEKRLSAIREFTELGSGYKIAMKDLEIRGAGSLLGESQSGHMALVGYDMYVNLLSTAIKKKQGKLLDGDMYKTNIDIKVDAFIPASYIVNEYQKLDIYKRIAASENDKELDELIDELIDRYGDLPSEVLKLFDVARLKVFAHNLFIIDIEQKGREYNFKMYEHAKVDVTKIPVLLERFDGDLSIANGNTVAFIYYKKQTNVKEEPMDVVKKVLDGISSLVIQ